jgi:16S rRNA (cytosine967-C5)-methyltransferase
MSGSGDNQGGRGRAGGGGSGGGQRGGSGGSGAGQGGGQRAGGGRGNGGPRDSSNRNAKGRERNRASQRSFTDSAPSQRTRRADPARLVAFEVLRAVAAEDAYANLVLPARIRHHGLDKRDAGFATELSYGALRSQGTYDAILSRCVDRPLGPAGPGHPGRAPARSPSAAGHARSSARSTGPDRRTCPRSHRRGTLSPHQCRPAQSGCAHP